MQDETLSAGRGDQGGGLVELLRNRTQALHLQAERSGVIRDLLRGKASLYGYGLLIRNLLPAYQRMEQGLAALAGAPGIRAILRPELERAGAIESDLEALYGSEWAAQLPLLEAGQAYVDRMAAASEGDGVRLIAHAYVRYMGDLSGGQIVHKILVRSLSLDAGALSLYAFPAIADIETFKAEYRAALDQAGLEVGDISEVVEEAAEAFRLNIGVSEAVHQAAAGGA